MTPNRALIITITSILLSACGGGGSSSGGSEAPATPPVSTPPAPTTQPGEPAIRCLANVQVRANRTALVQNSCPFAINVRQTNSRFPQPSPITLIEPGQLLAIPLGDDQFSIGFGACRAPSVPQSTEPGFFRCTDITVESGTSSNSKREIYRALMVN